MSRIRELGPDAFDTVRSNLDQLNTRLDQVKEQRRICIEMLVDALVNDPRADHREIYYRVKDAVGGNNVEDKAYICGLLWRYGGNEMLLGYDSLSEGEVPLKGTEGRISYVKNKRTDDAYLAFAKRVKGAKAEYAVSFSESCEAVYSNNCEYCILPIENNKSGKIYSFYSMLDRYDLKIVRRIEISNDDGSENTVYALVGRRIDLSVAKESGVTMEFSVINDRADGLGDIIALAVSLGGSITSVGSLPVEYDDRSRRFYLTSEFSRSPVAPFAICLELEYNGYTPLGLYKN